MRKRTKARELALQILYGIDITKSPPDLQIATFWENHDRTEEEVMKFANVLVLGVCEKQKKIDALISEHATNWQLKRMAVIDRNILRFATYELLFMDDIPPKVSINEAIDMAKRYGDRDSGKFVNGILDKINKTEGKKTE